MHSKWKNVISRIMFFWRRIGVRRFPKCLCQPSRKHYCSIVFHSFHQPMLDWFTGSYDFAHGCYDGHVAGIRWGTKTFKPRAHQDGDHDVHHHNDNDVFSKKSWYDDMIKVWNAAMKFWHDELKIWHDEIVTWCVMKMLKWCDDDIMKWSNSEMMT